MRSVRTGVLQDVMLFRRIGRSSWYWLAMIVSALALETVALYYQYALNQYPCVLCIHARLWVFAFLLIGIAGLALRNTRWRLVVTHALSLIAAVGLTERSWQLLGTERGWSELLSCSMDAGLPSWFALDHWFPAVFGVQASCGYTPILAFNVTMAEALIVISATATLVTLMMLAASLMPASDR